MIDFGALPPEINSGRIYTGPGSGPMTAAAEAWDGLAAELHAAAARYSSAISGLTARWQGASSLTMAAAIAPYTAWLTATAVQAEQTASQVRGAVAAYETAFAATVPPAAVAANRARLLALIATNLFGQNTPAIMETQAEYIEMWAQDAAAMYGYAGSSATAARVTPFSSPPQTTNSAAAAGQAAAAVRATGMAAEAHTQTLPQLMVALPSSLQHLATPASLSSLSGFLTGTYSPISLYAPVGSNYLLGIQSFLAPFSGENVQMAFGEAQAAAVGGGTLNGAVGSAARVVGSGSASVSAGLGRAGLVGNLSVPNEWAMAAPAVKPVAAVFAEPVPAAASAVAATQGEGNLFGNMALSSLVGRATAGTGAAAAARSAGAGGGAAAGEAGGPVNIFVIPAVPQ